MSQLFFDRKLWASIVLQPLELGVWDIKTHLKIQSISLWNQKPKGLAWVLRVLILGQSNLKSLHKRQKSRFNLQGTVYRLLSIDFSEFIFIECIHQTYNWKPCHEMQEDLERKVNKLFPSLHWYWFCKKNQLQWGNNCILINSWSLRKTWLNKFE